MPVTTDRAAWRILPLVALLLLAGSARAADGPRWRLDFGPYGGYYDFDPSTQFQDGAMGGLRLGLHRDSWFRFEAGFDEVYTKRKPVGNAARQIALSVHGRIEPQWWTVAPSALAGVGFVLFDDSNNPDAFSEGYDFGAGLAWRVSPSWRLRTDFVMRYQKFRIRDPELPVDDPDALTDPVGMWGRALRIGAFYDFPTHHRDGTVAEHPLELGAYAGYWDFDEVFRYEDDAVLGLRGGVQMLRWLTLEVELDQITTSNTRTGAWSQTISFAIHGLVEPFSMRRWQPGLLTGVAFMGLDNRLDFDSVNEGFDIGPTLRLRTSDRLSLRADALLRYQSVRVNSLAEDGSFLPDEEIDYVWSYGIRVGVGFAL